MLPAVTVRQGFDPSEPERDKDARATPCPFRGYPRRRHGAASVDPQGGGGEATRVTGTPLCPPRTPRGRPGPARPGGRQQLLPAHRRQGRRQRPAGAGGSGNAAAGQVPSRPGVRQRRSGLRCRRPRCHGTSSRRRKGREGSPRRAAAAARLGHPPRGAHRPGPGRLTRCGAAASCRDTRPRDSPMAGGCWAASGRWRLKGERSSSSGRRGNGGRPGPRGSGWWRLEVEVSRPRRQPPAEGGWPLRRKPRRTALRCRLCSEARKGAGTQRRCLVSGDTGERRFVPACADPQASSAGETDGDSTLREVQRFSQAMVLPCKEENKTQQEVRRKS